MKKGRECKTIKKVNRSTPQLAGVVKGHDFREFRWFEKLEYSECCILLRYGVLRLSESELLRQMIDEQSERLPVIVF